MRLIIVRHGETYENLHGITQGHTNTQLTPKGRKQARRVAERLKDERIDAAYTSDLDRALHTCQEILKLHPSVEPATTPLLREQAKGIHEGTTHKERDRMLKESGTPFHKWRPEGGETLEDVKNRTTAFLQEMEGRHRHQNVLVITHGGPISCMLATLKGQGLESFKDHKPKENTAVTTIDLHGEKPQFRTVNCTRHLD